MKARARRSRQPSRSGAFRGAFFVVEPSARVSESAVVWNLAYIGHRAVVGAHVTIGSLAHIADDARIGEGTKIEAGAYIGKRARIGNNCFIGPHAVLTGDPFPPVRLSTGVPAWQGVVVEDGAVIGANATVRAGVRIGTRAVVAMGAVVISDVPPETVVAGVPARPIYTRQEYDRRQREWALKVHTEASADGRSPLTSAPGRPPPTPTHPPEAGGDNHPDP